MPGHLQGLAIEVQHIDRFVEHGLRQQGATVSAPHHALCPPGGLGLCNQRKLAPVHAVHHDEAVVVVRLVGLGPVRAVLDVTATCEPSGEKVAPSGI